MLDGWIEKDSVPHAELPAWARDVARAPPYVALDDEGLALVTKKHGTVVHYREVFGLTSLPEPEDTAYLLVARKPPHPPWIEVRADMLPAEMIAAGVSGFVRFVEGRTQNLGYREARVERPRLPVHELHLRLLEREPIPGAVEIPFGRQTKPSSRAFTAFIGGLGGTVVSGYGFLFLAKAALPVAAVLGIGAVPIVVGAALGAGILNRKAAPKPRILALAPDGCVMGLYDGVHAFAWDEIGRFDVQPGKTGYPALALLTPGGRVLAALDESFFGMPLPFIVAVAEAYRSRAIR